MFVFPTGRPKRQIYRPNLDSKLMTSGVLLAVAVLAFVAGMLLLLDGKAGKWARQVRDSHQTRLGAPARSGK